MKGLAAVAQDLDLDGMADRIDRVVAVGMELLHELLREGTGARTPPQLLTDVDHALAGLGKSPRRELLSDHVREREGREAARLEKLDAARPCLLHCDLRRR